MNVFTVRNSDRAVLLPARGVAMALVLGGIVGIGLFIRCSFFRNFVNPEGGFFFYSVDAHDHLRRVMLGIQAFPAVPVRDSYMGYPVGTGQIWSPLFDYMLAAIAVVACRSRAAVETLCFFANPAYAGLTLLLLFVVARRLLSHTPGALAAAFLLALSPGHISYTHPMNFDHHVFEPIAVLVLTALVFLERDDRLSVAGTCGVAAALVITIFMWRGSTIYWGLTFLRVLIWSLVARRPRLAREHARGFAAAAVALALFVWMDPWGNARNVSFGIVSGFHVILLGLAALCLGVVGCAADRRQSAIALAAVALGLLLSLTLSPVRQVLHSLLAGLAFFGRSGDPWLASNSELKGTFYHSGFFAGATYLTLYWFLAPGAVAHAFGRWLRVDGSDRRLFAFCFIGPLLAMGFVLRYVHIAGLATAFAGGYLFALAWEKWRQPMARAGTVALLLLLLLPSLPHYQDTLQSRLPDPMRMGLFGSKGVLTWLRDNTPKTAHYLDPIAVPEYGVMAEWDLGAMIYQVAERPAVSTAFGWETHGFYEENTFMATTEAEVAERILNDNRVRYVLLRAYEARAMHFAIAEYGVKEGKVPGALVGAYQPDRSIYTRLMYNDGAAYRLGAEIVPGLEQYRLLYESDYLASDDPGSGLSYYKVFEFVRGARVVGTATPGSDVVLELPLLTSRRRLLRYTNSTKATQNGRFMLTLPYATNVAQGDTVAQGAYAIVDDNGRRARLEVTEADVVSGNSLSVILADPGGR